MPISKETLQQIEKALGISGLVEANASEQDQTVTIPEDITVFTKDELTTLKNNEYKSGKEKGVEMAIKEVKEKQGLDFQGKTIEGLVEAVSKKAVADAGKEPNKQVEEYAEKVKTLQNTVKEYEQKLSEKDNEVAATKINTELGKYIPAPSEEGPAFDQEDIIRKMEREGYQFKYEDSKVVAYKGGNKATDKLGNDLPVGDVVTGFLREKKFITEPITPGGRGDGDRKPVNVPTKLTELKKQFTDNGKSLLGKEFSAAVEQAKKDNPEFDLSA